MKKEMGSARPRARLLVVLGALVFAALYGIPVASATAATCNGVAATITGTAGDDTITGTAGNDVIAGLGGNDTIDGGGGNDVICGGLGNDSITGGAGIDTVSYAESATAVTVTLAAGTGSGEGADTYSGVENVVGSALADKLTGDTNANALSGLGGADTLDGGSGNDTLNGGAGADTASFASSASAVTANLGTGTATGNGTDTLAAIENLRGSSFNDTLTGNAGANVVDGGNGSDTLDGGAGTDVVSFASSTVAVHASMATGTSTGPGTDSFTNFESLAGSPKGDVLTGTAGADSIDGAAGTDTCHFANGADKGKNCEIVDGAIETAGVNDVYTYTGKAGDKVFVDMRSPNASCSTLTWTLGGPGGTIVTPTSVCSDRGPITLATAGTYTVTIASLGSPGTGSYSFAYLKVPAPQTFAYTLGTTVSANSPLTGEGKIETPGAQDHYTFSASAGDKIFYNALNGAGDNCNFQRTFHAPGGAIVSGGDGFVCTNVTLTLPTTGTYELDVYPSVNADTVGTYSFSITTTPPVQTFAYTIGTTVGPNSPMTGEGDIEVIGAEDDYTFNGTAGQKIFYDFLSSTDCNFQRTLVGPGGIVSGGDGFVCSDVGPLTLPSNGTYTLRIHPAATASDTGTYSFKIVNVPAVQSFAYTIGTTVGPNSPMTGEGNIEQIQSEDDYTFTGAAGQKVFYDFLTATNCNFHRTLVGPGGIVPGADGFVCSNLGPITLPSAGTYTLRIYGGTNSDQIGTYSFKIVNVPAVQTFAYTLGTTVGPNSPMTGEGNIEQIQGEDDYTFHGTAGGHVTYQAVSLSGANCNFQRTLVAPDGTNVSGGDGFVCSTTASLTLPQTGTYKLRVYDGTNSDETGTYSFKVTSP